MFHVISISSLFSRITHLLSRRNLSRLFNGSCFTILFSFLDGMVIAFYCTSMFSIVCLTPLSKLWDRSSADNLVNLGVHLQWLTFQKAISYACIHLCFRLNHHRHHTKQYHNIFFPTYDMCKHGVEKRFLLINKQSIE